MDELKERNINYKDMKDIILLEDLLKIKTDKILLLEIKEREIDKNKLLKLLNKFPSMLLRCIKSTASFA